MRTFRYTGDHPTETQGYCFQPGAWVAVDDPAAAKLAANPWFEERPPATGKTAPANPNLTRAVRRAAER
ncbi:MAG: hypothetical protein OEY97_11490 [Nitrospirota bacterium]|nr:hypothetical protein [Nitrospirota bacterium]